MEEIEEEQIINEDINSFDKLCNIQKLIKKESSIKELCKL